MGKFDGPDHIGDHDPVTGDGPTVTAEFAGPLGARDRVAPGLQLQQSAEETVNLVNEAHHAALALFDFVLGQLVVVKDDHFLDGPPSLRQVFAKTKHFLNNAGGAREGLEHFELPALDPLGNLHFAFAGE